MTNSENNKRIAKNTAMLYVRMLFTIGVALYTSRVVLQTLGVEDFGLYNVVGGVVTMFLFLNGALGASTSRFITVYLGENNLGGLNKAFSISIVNHLILAALIFILAETIGLWFVMNKLQIPPERFSAVIWVYQFSIVTCLISLLQSPYLAVIIAYEKMNIYAWLSIVDSILKLSILYVLVMFDYDKLVLYSALMCVVTFSLFFTYYVYVRMTMPHCRFYFYKDKEMYKTMISYSGWDLLGNLSGVAQGQGLNILLNMFFGAGVNAARGISYQLQGAVTQFSGNFMIAVRPQIIKYYASGEREQMNKLIFASSKFSFFLLWLLSLPVFIEVEYILRLWLQVVPDYTVIFTRIIIVVAWIGAFRTPVIAGMHASGQIKIPNIVCGSLLIATLPIAYIALRMGGDPVSVFWVLLLVTFLNWGIEVFLINRIIRFSIRAFITKVCIKSLIVAVPSFLVTWWVSTQIEQGFLRLVYVVLLGTALTAIMVYSFGIDRETREMFLRKAKLIIKR